VVTAVAAQGSPAALADPVDRPQHLDCGGVVSAAAMGLASGGTSTGPAIGRQLPAAATPVELRSRLALAAARTALDGGHAADPAGW
jgi:hypothetical protein